MAESPLTTIARLAQQIFKALPAGSDESNKAFQIWKMAGDQGDARSWQDEPTVKAAKKRAQTSTK